METEVKENFMVHIGGETFRCECGCNVFHKWEDEDLVFVCNGCRALYIGEREDGKVDEEG